MASGRLGISSASVKIGRQPRQAATVLVLHEGHVPEDFDAAIAARKAQLRGVIAEEIDQDKTWSRSQ